MTPQRPWNLFALVDDPDDPVRRLPLAQPLQVSVNKIFQDQFSSLFAGSPEEVPFDVRLNPDESEIFFISGFDPPPKVWEAIRNPAVLERIDVNEDSLEKTKGLFVGDYASRRIFLQVFDKRRLLSTRGLTILLSGDTFKRLEDPGLTLDTQLAAAFVSDR